MESKVWFITGASSGFGYEVMRMALERGDRVAAAARRIQKIKELTAQYPDRLLPVRLDVTDREAVMAAVQSAHSRFGRIDVAFSNAGGGHFGPVEELTEQELRDQMEKNFFGSFHFIQAVLPIMRSQRSGHVLQTTSIGGITAYPFNGAYHATKWALEGMLQSLAQEVASFNIHVTAIEPGAFGTNFVSACTATKSVIADYKQTYEGMLAYAESSDQFAEAPFDAARIIIRVADAEDAPYRILLGTGALDAIKTDYQQRIAEWENWKWEDMNNKA